MVGKFIVYRVFYGGFGMVGLSLVVIKYLVIGLIDEVKEFVLIDDLYDLEL